MKTIILAGGLGSRLSEETHLKPKPMVEVGDWPILKHIMSIYAAHDFKEFVVALGYKGEYIKEYFLNYFALNSDLSLNLGTGERKMIGGKRPDWLVDLVDTGKNTMTGGRIGRLRDWIGDETFMLTYGDGLANVDIKKLVQFHRAHGKAATLTAVRPPARYGALVFDGDRIDRFSEKPQTGEGWINGGFFVLEPKVFDYIDGDDTIWERTPLERLAQEGELMAFRHEGFWQAMDTLREKNYLTELWNSGKPPWKVW